MTKIAAIRDAASRDRALILDSEALATLGGRPSRRQEEVRAAMRAAALMLARLVGGVLTGAKADSRHLADAHVVAAAVETGGGVVLTGDPDDLASLAGPYPNITVQPLP
jgi:hypothetical protein